MVLKITKFVVSKHLTTFENPSIMKTVIFI